MSKFHDFDPLDMLLECQRLSQTAFNNTQELARSHNQMNMHLCDLVNQHNQVIELVKNSRREIQRLQQELNEIKRHNSNN